MFLTRFHLLKQILPVLPVGAPSCFVNQTIEINQGWSLPFFVCAQTRNLFCKVLNTASVQETKRTALAEHQSQQNWLDVTQGLDSLGGKVDEVGRVVGKLSKKFKFAEGWRRHLHYGFSATEVDPLREALGKDYLVNKAYERRLIFNSSY